MMKWCIVLLLIVFHINAWAANLKREVYTEEKSVIMVSNNQAQFEIHLKSNPATGYHWFLGNYDEKLMTPIKHTYQAPNAKIMGASGEEIWVFAMKPASFVVPQVTQIRFLYTRPWDIKSDDKFLMFRVTAQ